MSSLDQFESVFNAAAKDAFTPQSIQIKRILIIQDLREELQDDFLYLVKGFLAVLEKKTEVKWEIFGSEKPSKIHAILESVENYRPDLIVTYRHLHCDSVDWSYGLGIHIDVLTQATTTPVLILPNPDRNNLANSSFKRTKKVMAVTDHLAGDHSLVSYAALFTQTDGTLFLAHVEDKSVFDRYIKAVSKIPDLDTETASEQIKARLLKDPNDYVESCKKRLTESLPTINIERWVKLGSRMSDYRNLIDENEIDLLVMYTKDDEQLAMHGVAYPLAVELKTTPLLML
tara:strand:- start:3462 stop:4322 length:861 start_codon:yes stop_codon:yes gene_type:complete